MSDTHTPDIDPIAVPPSKPMRHSALTEAAAELEVLGDQAEGAELPSASKSYRAMAAVLREVEDPGRRDVERAAFLGRADRVRAVARLWRDAVRVVNGLTDPPADGISMVRIAEERAHCAPVSWRQASMWLQRHGWTMVFGHLWQNDAAPEVKTGVYVPPTVSAKMLAGAIHEIARAEGMAARKVLMEMSAIWVPEEHRALPEVDVGGRVIGEDGAGT